MLCHSLGREYSRNYFQSLTKECSPPPQDVFNIFQKHCSASPGCSELLDKGRRHSRDVGQRMARTSEDRPLHHLFIEGSFVICGLDYIIDGDLNHSIVFLFLICKRKSMVLVIPLIIYYVKNASNLQFLIRGDVVVCACELLPTPAPCCWISPPHWPSPPPECVPLTGDSETPLIHHLILIRLHHSRPGSY